MDHRLGISKLIWTKIYFFLAILLVLIIFLQLKSYDKESDKIIFPLKYKIPFFTNYAPKVLIYKRFFASYIILSDVDKQIKGTGMRTCMVERSNKTTNFDAIIIDYMEIYDFIRLYKSVKVRFKKLMIIVIYEPPIVSVKSEGFKHLEEYFDIYVWSYFRDSEFYHPFGQTFAKHVQTKINEIDLLNQFDRRQSAGVAFISNCKGRFSKRLNYINKLKRYFPIDVFGACGSKYIKDSDFADVIKNYKFFLSFENSMCTDYLTEKFWRSFVYGTIPVVYGGANYKLLSPNDSYIDILDYQSVEELSKFLKKVSSDFSEYKNFFTWSESQFTVRNDLLNKPEFKTLICDRVQDWMKGTFFPDKSYNKIRDLNQCKDDNYP